MLYAKVVLTVKEEETISDKQVVLYRGDGNVDIEFTLRSTDYVLSECVEAQLILLRPYAKSIFSELSEINQNKVRFTIATDMIDELAELESYVIQIRLFGPDKVARVTLPPCYDVLQIRNPLTMEPSEEPQYITDFTFGDKDAVRLNGPTGVTDKVYIYPAEEGLPMNFEVHMPDSPGWETVNYVFYNETNPYVELRLLASTHNLEGSLRVIETYSGIEKTIPIYVRPEIRLTVHYRATDNDYTDDYLEFKMESDTAGYVHFGPAKEDDYGRVGYITLKIDTVYTPELRYNSAMSMIILDDIVNLTSDTEIWISDDSTTVYYSRPRPMHTLTVHYKCTDGHYEDDVLQIRSNDGIDDDYELHLNGHSDAYGTVNVIRIREGIYHIYLEDKSPEFNVISYGNHDIVSDIEIWINDYEDEIYYENPNPYYVEYTIDVADDCTETVGYADTYGTPYLPKINDEIPTNVTIKLKDGTTTTSFDTLAKDVESIKVDYDENTQKIIFGYASGNTTSSKISEINYIYISNKITSMSGVFYKCSSLTSLDLSNWDVSNVTSMIGVFNGCSSLTSLDVSNWDTSNVTSMIGVFYNCSSLTSLDVSNWDTSNVTSMTNMFYNCSSLTSLDVSNWDTSNFRDTKNMFQGCSSLTSLDVSNWDVSNVYFMTSIFKGCSSLTSLDLSNWDTSNVTSTYEMFYNCSSLTSLDVSNWDTNNVGDATNMFKGIPEISDWNYDGSNYTNFTLTESDTGYAGTFPWNEIDEPENPYYVEYTIDVADDCAETVGYSHEYGYPYLPMINSVKPTNVTIKLKDGTTTTSLNTLAKDVESIKVDYDENTQEIIFGYPPYYKEGNDAYSKISGINYIYFSNKITNTFNMFYNCSSLTSLDVSNWDTSNVTNMGNMFYNCKLLTSLDLSNWDVSKVEEIFNMFYNCSSLTSLDVSNWDTNNVGDATNMFKGIPEISNWHYDGTNYTNFTLTESDTGYAGTFPWSNKVTVAKYTFTSTTDTLPTFNSEFTNYTTIDVNNGDGTTTRTIAIGKTDTLPTSIKFQGKAALLTVEELDISNLTKMANLFTDCTHLTSVNMDEWDTSNIKDMQYMFYNCKLLTSLNLSHFNTANVTNMGYMFHSCSGLTSVDLTNWNTAKVTATKGMFNGCTSLTSLDLSHFNTTKVTDMNKMFQNCTSLTSLDLSNWDTGIVKNATSMFQNIPEISDWNYDGNNYTNFTLTESDTGYVGTFPWNEPDEPETVILTLHFYTPDRYMGECALINEVDSSLEATEHYFELEDDFGLYTTIEVKTGVAYYIALTSFGDIFAEGVFSFAEDTELWTIKLDSTIYTENPGSNWTLTVHYYHPEDDQYAESVIRISESVFEDGEYTSTNVVYCNFELTGETCYEDDFGRYITMNYKRGRPYAMSLNSTGFDLYIGELVRYLNIGANTDLWIIDGDSTIYKENPKTKNPF